MKALVIADDFTGANDTGMQLAKNGARTEVLINPLTLASTHADVLVLNTESRGLSAEEANAKITRCLASLKPEKHDILLYKKIDSTLRGNIGAEIEAVMVWGKRQVALVTPALPSAGRTTFRGECLVNGIPVLETEFASDPKTPVHSSHIKTLIMQQSSLPVFEISLDQVRKKLPELIRTLMAKNERCIIVLDAISREDLALIATTGLALGAASLFVGSAGLADAIPTSCYRNSRYHLPMLTISGSMSEATWRQVEYVNHHSLATTININVATLCAPDYEAYISDLMRQSCKLLSSGRHCILRTCRTLDERMNIDRVCQKYQLSRQQLGITLNQRLGQLALQVIDNTQIGALFLTGGDIATAVAQALGASGYRIQGEVAPCIPWGTLINSEIDDLPVITKAGGFGVETTLMDIINFVEEMYCE